MDSLYSKDESIIHGIAIAINDFILDAVEDAAVDSDIEPTEADMHEGDELVAPELPEKTLEDKILDAVITMLRARRSMASDWDKMREIFPRERFTL